MQTLAFVFWGIFKKSIFPCFLASKLSWKKSETTNVMRKLQAIQWYAVLRLETIFRKVGLDYATKMTWHSRTAGLSRKHPSDWRTFEQNPLGLTDFRPSGKKVRTFEKSVGGSPFKNGSAYPRRSIMIQQQLVLSSNTTQSFYKT